jgi:ubiquitin C-terminal hydrolase
MGRSAKKKRQKERQRQERLHQLSTFGALNLTSKAGSTTGSTVANNQLRQSNELLHDLPDEESNGTSHIEIPVSQSLPSSRSRDPSPSSSVKVDSFGSSSSRTQTLPVVTFVYPRSDSGQKNRQEPKPYEFGTSEERSTNVEHVQRHNPVNVNSNESIDDILYQTVKQKKSASLGRTLVTSKTNNDNEARTPVSTVEPNTVDAETPQISIHPKQTEVTHPLPYLSGISVEEAVRDKAGLRPRANSTDGELKLPQRGLCDERTVLKCYKWTSAIGTSISAPKGFHNLGNTCFLNSTLQCLAYCPPLCQLLMNMPGAGDAAPNTSGKKINQGKMFTHMLSALFRRIHNADNAKMALSPRKIVSALPLLGSGSTRRNGYKFRPGRQEDAHEFLVHLLDAMNTGELRQAGINANKSGWRDRLPVPRLDETTFVHRIFGGYLRSQVRCTDCGYRSNTYDPFLDLSLEISRNSCHSLASAFNEFTRKETLDSQNRWKCSGCNKRVCATKQLTVFRPPLVLCVQLKRFTFGGSSGGFRGGGKKISKPIEFPVQLQLPLSDGRSCGYVLTGLVIHVGGSASSGHYTAYVQRPGSNGDRKWFHMDDSYVQPVSEQNVLRQHNAYVIMYCRQEVKVEFPTPPLRGSMTTDEAKNLALSRQKAKSSNIKSSETPNYNDDASETLENEASTETAFSSPDVSSSSGRQTTHVDGTKSLPVSNGFNGGVETTIISETETVQIEGPTLKGHANGIKSDTEEIDKACRASTDLHESNELNTVAQENELITETNGLVANSHDQGKSSLPAKKSNQSFSVDSLATNVLNKSETLRAMDQQLTKDNTIKSKAIVSGDRGGGGKVEVVVRSQLSKQRAWIPSSAHAQTNEKFVLLGNIPVSKWDDEEKVGEVETTDKNVLDARTKIAKDIQIAEQDRKRKMFLDRHDTLLDQGKVC